MRKFLILFVIILPAILSAAYLQNIPTQVAQPDGTVLDLYATGDEFANRLHDENGYTIIQSQTDGYFYYAEQDRESLVPSAFKAGTVNPQSKSLVPNLTISEAEYKEKVRFMQQHDNPSVRTPSLGTVNNLCILIRFADQTEFDTPRFVFEDKFNSVGDSANSQRSYYQKVSYNQLDIITAIYPNSLPDINVSYQDSHPRAYFMPYNAITNTIGYTNSDQRAQREQAMLASAVAFVATQIPSFLNLDADNDGYVDNVCFVIRGPHTAWAELLWAHRWFLYYSNAFINGKQVGDYTFQPENQNEVYILCHEMFHSIGAPDLYHYDFNGVSPVGCWDLMEAGKGHMGAYMKYKYGSWLPAPQTIDLEGNYAINPLTSNSNSFYRINAVGSTSEYFVLEYRKKGSDFFEQNLPDSGMLIYRIRNGLNGNADGPPDEVYIMRPNGSQTVNGNIAHAAFSLDNGLTEFNDFTNPASKFTNGQLAHLNINSISACGDTISFYYSDVISNLPPTLNFTNPQEGEVLIPGVSYAISASFTTHGSPIDFVEFEIDGLETYTVQGAPFSFLWLVSQPSGQYHVMTISAITETGLTTTRKINFRIVDPMLETWFNWTTDTPVYSSFGRGSIPIQVAVDLDLGTEDYVIKQLAFHVEDDPFGDPSLPGLVSAKINRFTNGLITTQTLLNLGDFIVPTGVHHETPVNDSTVLSGKIALIVNLYEYQNIVFDNNGVTGHTWLTEPDRPWTDAQGRGMLGAADLGIKVQSPYVGNDENVIYPSTAKLSVYPNPFGTQTSINFNLEKDNEISIAVYNLKGQKVCTVYNGKQAKGSHSLSWKGVSDTGQTVGNGIYFIRLTEPGQKIAVRKVILLK